MFKDIIIGQYLPGKSPLHRLDPRIKIILTIAYLALIFAADKWSSYIIAAVYTSTIVIVSGIPFRFIFKGIRPVLWILLFTAVINIFAVPGQVVAAFPVFKLTVTREGIITAALISVRLILIVTAASLLTLTTPPLSLTDGIERLLRPLEKIRVPVRDIAMMMTIAIRFIPTLSEEAEKIKKAQLSRGADFESGGIIKRAKAMLPIIIPLFLSAFRRADALAEAMDARCYGGKARTRMRELKLTSLDAAAVIIFAVCAAVLLAAEFVIEF